MSQEEKAEYAKQLFKNRTRAEKKFSKRLVSHKIEFEEQVVIGSYIVDFLFRSKNLIIELDGNYHTTPAQIAYDESRTRQLNRMGFKVIRVWNKEVGSCDITSLIKFQQNRKKKKPKTKYQEWKQASNLLTRSIESKFRRTR